MDTRSIWLKLYEASSLLPERRHDKSNHPGLPRVGVVGMSYGSLAMAYRFPRFGCRLFSRSPSSRAHRNLCLSALWPAAVNPLAAAAAGLLVNARHVPFGVTVRELVGKRGLSLLGCHIMNDESVVFGLSQKTPEQS